MQPERAPPAKDLVVRLLRTREREIMFFSVHLYDVADSPNYEFYPGSGGEDDLDCCIVNVPLAPRASTDAWRAASRACAS